MATCSLPSSAHGCSRIEALIESLIESLVEALVETLIEADCLPHQVRIYGYSVGFGGAEGGPPGRGMRDHSEVAALIQKALLQVLTTAPLLPLFPTGGGPYSEGSPRVHGHV